MSAAFLFEMGWKSALIVSAVLVVVVLMRSRPAWQKGDLLRVALLFLPVLPLVALLAPALTIETTLVSPLPAVAPAPSPINAQEIPAHITRPHVIDFDAIILGIYAAGAMLLLARLALGLAVLHKWVSGARPTADAAWTRAADAAGVRVLVSQDISAPLSCGLRRPVILIDRATLGRTEQARAIIAHEKAHIARADWAVLIGMRITTALFWFNPFVWVAKHAAEQFAEHAADHEAVRAVEPTFYAQTLLDCACRTHLAVPAMRIGGSPPAVAQRVRMVLTMTAQAPTARAAILSSLAIAALAAAISAAEVTAAPAPVAEQGLRPAARVAGTPTPVVGLVAAVDRRVAQPASAVGAPALESTSDVEPLDATERGRLETEQRAIDTLQRAETTELRAAATEGREIATERRAEDTRARAREGAASERLAGAGYTPRVLRDLGNAADMRAEAQELRNGADHGFLAGSAFLERGEALRRADRLEDRAAYLETRAELRRQWDARNPDNPGLDTGDDEVWP